MLPPPYLVSNKVGQTKPRADGTYNDRPPTIKACCFRHLFRTVLLGTKSHVLYHRTIADLLRRLETPLTSERVREPESPPFIPSIPLQHLRVDTWPVVPIDPETASSAAHYKNAAGPLSQALGKETLSSFVPFPAQ